MARNENASYESSDNKRTHVSGIDTSLSGKHFASLAEFVTATNSVQIQTNRGASFNFLDTTGWCAMQFPAWYKCLMVRYENYVGSSYDVSGVILISYSNNLLFFGSISGGASTTADLSVQWTSIKGDAVMRGALPVNSSMLNGHLVAGANGSAAIAAHANGTTATQYRVQLNNDGNLCKYTSTDSGGNFTFNGRYVMNSEITTWSSVTVSIVNSSYVASMTAPVYQNSYIKMASANIAVYITSSTPSGAAIISGFPKPPTTLFLNGTMTGSVARRFQLKTDGKLYTDGTVSSQGWYSISASYPYSSL